MQDQVPKLMGSARDGALNACVTHTQQHQAHLVVERTDTVQPPPIVLKEETTHAKIFEHRDHIVRPTVPDTTAFADAIGEPFNPAFELGSISLQLVSWEPEGKCRPQNLFDVHISAQVLACRGLDVG